MVVVAARCAFESLEGLAAVGRAIQAGLYHVNHVGIIGRYVYLAEIGAAIGARVGGAAMPVGAAIVGAEHAAGHHREDALPSRAGGHRQADPAHAGFREAVAGEGGPGEALVGRFVDARSRSVRLRCSATAAPRTTAAARTGATTAAAAARI